MFPSQKNATQSNGWLLRFPDPSDPLHPAGKSNTNRALTFCVCHLCHQDEGCCENPFVADLKGKWLEAGAPPTYVEPVGGDYIEHNAKFEEVLAVRVVLAMYGCHGLPCLAAPAMLGPVLSNEFCQFGWLYTPLQIDIEPKEVIICRKKKHLFTLRGVSPYFAC